MEADRKSLAVFKSYLHDDFGVAEQDYYEYKIDRRHEYHINIIYINLFMHKKQRTYLL